MLEPFEIGVERFELVVVASSSNLLEGLILEVEEEDCSSTRRGEKREERELKLTWDRHSMKLLPSGNLSDETILSMKDLREKLKRIEGGVGKGRRIEGESWKQEELEEEASSFRRWVEAEEVEWDEPKEFDCY